MTEFKPNWPKGEGGFPNGDFPMTGGGDMCESNEDKLSRVQQMVHDDGLTWDLSPNDKDALAFLLSEYDRLQAMSGNVALVVESFNADAISDRDEMKRENRKLQAEVERLREQSKKAAAFIKEYASNTFYYWDDSQDSKVGKRLSALGGMQGYDHALDRVFADLEQG